MKKIVFIKIFILGTILVTNFGDALLIAAKEEGVHYKVIMPKSVITKNTNLIDYSDQIRTMNIDSIQALPIDQQQDAIREVLKVIANIRKDEINEITKMKADGLATRGWSNYGNVLVTLDAAEFTFAGIKWSYGHAAIAGTATQTVIEAQKEFGVRVANNYNSYFGAHVRNTDEQYVSGASQAKYNGAIAYAMKQKGKPYGIKTQMSDLTTWYCSKLVCKAWESQGYTLKNTAMGGDIILGLVGVTPKQILYDNDLVWYQKVPKSGY